MKRFLAILTVALMAGCCVAFADSSDNANTASNDTMNSAQNQEPGTTMKESTTTIHKSAKLSKTCTDESGNTFKRGEPGFKACWNAQHPKQESGTAAKEESKEENKMESQENKSGDTSMNTGNPNDTSGSQNQNY